MVERGRCATTGRDADDSRRHCACDRAAIEGRMVCLRRFKASREGALRTIMAIAKRMSLLELQGYCVVY
jgi:hypothetical protein